MKRVIVLASLVAFSGVALAGQYVKGYVRKDGTYVQPHFRSSQNSTRIDNFSTQGNVNPYTGQRGYENPYPSLYNPPKQRRYGN